MSFGLAHPSHEDYYLQFEDEGTEWIWFLTLVGQLYDGMKAPIQQFCFSVKHKRYSTLHYKVGVVLDSSAQPKSNVHVPNMCKG